MIEPEHVEAAARKVRAPRTFWAWLTSNDPKLGWPVLTWLAFAMCLGIVIGAVL